MTSNPVPRPTLVLLVEDHALTRRGMVSCLEDTRRFFVMGQAASLAEARRCIETAAELPSLVILDLIMNGENGLDFLGFLKDFCRNRKIPAPPVLVSSAFEDPFRVQTALRAGAAGYVPKSSGEEDLLKAVDMVLAGKTSVDERLLPRVGDPVPKGYTKFTRREMEILNLIKQNKTNQQIAARLFINLRTVETHVSHIYLKTGCKTRQELVEV